MTQSILTCQSLEEMICETTVLTLNIVCALDNMTFITSAVLLDLLNPEGDCATAMCSSTLSKWSSPFPRQAY